MKQTSGIDTRQLLLCLLCPSGSVELFGVPLVQVRMPCLQLHLTVERCSSLTYQQGVPYFIGKARLPSRRANIKQYHQCHQIIRFAKGRFRLQVSNDKMSRRETV
jgi:hypothetical protein